MLAREARCSSSPPFVFNVFVVVALVAQSRRVNLMHPDGRHNVNRHEAFATGVASQSLERSPWHRVRSVSRPTLHVPGFGHVVDGYVSSRLVCVVRTRFVRCNGIGFGTARSHVLRLTLHCSRHQPAPRES